MIKHFEYNRLKKYSLVAMLMLVLLVAWTSKDDFERFLINYETKKDYELVDKCRVQKELSTEECFEKGLKNR